MEVKSITDDDFMVMVVFQKDSSEIQIRGKCNSVEPKYDYITMYEVCNM